MTLNTDNCQLIVSAYKHEHNFAKIGTEKLREKRDVKVLGINIGNLLKFDKRVGNMFQGMQEVNCLGSNVKINLSQKTKNLT